MEKVLGVGGVFFRARDPAALAAWYAAHLGIPPAPTQDGGVPWRTTEGFVVFAPFADDTDYFPADKAFMLNFRVRDLDAISGQLRAAGIAVEIGDEMPGVGRFARLHDPEGNPIELWEPAPGAE